MVNGLPLREIPGDSVIHRLWAGTKLIAIALVGVLMWVLPSWPALGAVAVVVVGVALLAGIPLGAVPKPPWWLWALAAASVGLSTLVAGVSGGLVTARSVLLGLLVIAVSVLVVWTTPAAQLAPAIATLLTPLRWLRLPVDEWAVVIALCLRSLPLMVDELMVLRAVHRLRPRTVERSASGSATDPGRHGGGGVVVGVAPCRGDGGGDHRSRGDRATDG